MWNEVIQLLWTVFFDPEEKNKYIYNFTSPQNILSSRKMPSNCTPHTCVHWYLQTVVIEGSGMWQNRGYFFVTDNCAELNKWTGRQVLTTIAAVLIKTCLQESEETKGGGGGGGGIEHSRWNHVTTVTSLIFCIVSSFNIMNTFSACWVILVFP